MIFTSKKATPLEPRSTLLQVDRDFAGRQILGSRDEQQDSYAFSIVDGDEREAGKILIIIADGMGGYTGGREASATAVSGFIDAFFDTPDSPPVEEDPPSEETDAVSEKDVEAVALKSALEAANQCVDKMIAVDPDTLGDAGTTLLAVVVERNSIRWISVGDSPLLLWREDKLTRLNADHSMRAVLAEKVAARQMTAKDVKTHPERNALLAAVTGLEIEQIDAPSAAFPLLSGDIILAASDGLLTLGAKEISQELRKESTATALDIVRRLLALVEKKANPKQDNTTVAIIKV